MAPGVDIFSQLSPILRSAVTSVYSSGQVFVQAGSGVDFFCLEFFKEQFGVSLKHSTTIHTAFCTCKNIPVSFLFPPTRHNRLWLK